MRNEKWEMAGSLWGDRRQELEDRSRSRSGNQNRATAHAAQRIPNAGKSERISQKTCGLRDHDHDRFLRLRGGILRLNQNHGGNRWSGATSDTVAAVAGGLAGVYYGVKGIPEEWLNQLVRADYIKELCEKFHRSLVNYSVTWEDWRNNNETSH